ncbi:MAG: GTPase, partial [Deltaproteobacteria bacterium]|nr:GTPase [Deltaproteobacteria bacterium]
GAAGRDFHNFNVFFRNNSQYDVKAFTAFQIPNIDNRTYPPELAGALYPHGIPIYPESELVNLIKKESIDEVVFAYSDVSYDTVMRRSATANAAGVDFKFMGPKSTMLKSRKPVVSVCAVRTGCGKSQTTRSIASLLRKRGKKIAIIRHPMPYGDLNAQRCQRFQNLDDLDKHKCTIEEREEYETHIQEGHIVYAGVDYEDILRRAEEEADIILWDGGNNDWPFYESNIHFVLVDPHRPGHELRYFPGEANFRMANVVLIAKSNTAPPEGITKVKENIKKYNPDARVIETASVIKVSDSSAIKGKRVLVVEDGPTLTHGEMSYGAAFIAAKQCGASEIVDPRPWAVGTIKKTFEHYSHLQSVLPAMGYGDKQIRELNETINAVPCDLVLVGTPLDLGKLLKDARHPVRHPMIRVSYELDEKSSLEIDEIIKNTL